MRGTIIITVIAVALSACARTSSTPVSRNEVLINTSAAPVCGRSGATEVASKMAAVETLRNGFDRFVILGAGSENNVSVVNRPPTGAYTTSNYTGFGNSISGTSTTTFTGGGPIITGNHDTQLHVRMLSEGDAGYENGVDARQTLGEDWREMVENGVNSC